MNPFGFIGRWIRKKHRNIDREVLFRDLRSMAGENISQFHKAVQKHVDMDSAWAYREEWVHEDILTGHFVMCGPHCNH